MQSLQGGPFRVACGICDSSCVTNLFRWIKIRLDNALALSAIVFILYQPFVLFQPGFQLSYIAHFLLFYHQEYLQKQSR